MNRSVQKGEAASHAPARTSLRATKLSPRQLQAAYPYVASLLQALATPRPRSIRRGTRRRSLAHAARA
jgi:hypothetical protein